MDHPQPTNIRIRTAVPEDSSAIAAFFQQYGNGGSQPAAIFLTHHCQTTWIATDTSGSFSGALLSWKSPAQYSTAIIENIAVIDQESFQVVAGELLSVAIKFWTQQCVRTLAAPCFSNQSFAAAFFVQQGFMAQQNQSSQTLYKILAPERICLHNKKMRPSMNTANGQVDEETLFHYFQDGDNVWGHYSGGKITQGVLMGKMNANRNIQFHYMQIDKDGNFGQGTSKSSTEFLNDGRLVLFENWQWTGNRSGSGNSIIEEVKE